ncbi:MAG: Flp family type IVb pilin [Pirellulales bacterium]|jgi:Flp pilus assembly pilin Flp
MESIKRFLRGSEAATAVEYAVMLALILIAVIGSIGAVGAQTGGMYGGIRDNLIGHGLGN